MSALLLAACEPAPEKSFMALSAECGGAEPNAAISACTRLLGSEAIEPLMRARALVSRANARAATADYDAAIEDLSESIRLAPEVAPTFILRGNLLLRGKDDSKRAIDDYNQAIRLDPNIWEAYVQRGTAFGANRRFDRAIQDFNIALSLQPNDAGVLANRGSALVMAGQYAQAIPDLDEAIKAHPENAFLFALRGAAKLRSGDRLGADADMRRAERIDPDIAEKAPR